MEKPSNGYVLANYLGGAPWLWAWPRYWLNIFDYLNWLSLEKRCFVHT